VRRTNIEQARSKKHPGEAFADVIARQRKISRYDGDLDCDELPRSWWHVDCIA
jgi:hypothetical protein